MAALYFEEWENEYMEASKLRADNMSAVEELLIILQQQGMKEQSQKFEELLQYVGSMQTQLETMVNELRVMKKEVSEFKENQQKSVGEKTVDKIQQFQKAIKDLNEKMITAKNLIFDIAKQSINTFKEKGVKEMNNVLQKGILKVKSVLMDCKNQMTDICTEYEKKANQIDSIGDELKQIGNSVSNVGRLISGKGTKEITDERPGVGVTRVINAPIKKKISILKNQMDDIDKVCKKLDTFLNKLTNLENGKSDRVSVKEKISQMKEKVETKTVNNVQAKTKENTL